MRISDKKGFTLVEIMAAVAILSIALAAVFATFEFQQRSYTTQSQVAEMQQNLRLGMEYLARDVRLAGYGIPAPVSLPAGVIPGATSIRTLIPGDNAAGPDSVYIMYLYDMDANQPPTTITVAMPTSSSELNVASTTGFVDGDLIIISNGTNADLFQVTQVQSAALKLQHNPGGSSRDYNSPGGHSTWPAGGYGTGATLAKARFARYFIDNVTIPGRPILMMDRMGSALPQPVGDDIEDMQFRYGIDTTVPPDGVVDSWVDSPADPSLIRQVRIQLLSRTRLTERGWKDTSTRAMFNHDPGAANDGYRRRLVDMVVDVRNSGM